MLYKITSKEKDFTMQDVDKVMQEYFHAKIYNTLSEMAADLNWENCGDDFNDVSSYTDYSITEKNYRCYSISDPKFFPEGFNITSEIIIGFKNNIPTEFYGSTCLVKGTDIIKQMLNCSSNQKTY